MNRQMGRKKDNLVDGKICVASRLHIFFPFLFQHDDGCKDFVTSLCTQNLMQSALGLSSNFFGLKEEPILFVTRQLTELILTNGFKKVFAGNPH